MSIGSYTLLDMINRTLKRGKIIQGDTGALTSLTSSQHQHEIDVTVQIWNEVIHELFSRGAIQNEVKEGTVTLATDTREYSLPTDFEAMSGETAMDRVMVNASKNNLLHEYPGGYPRMYVAQPDPSDFTGQPSHYAINPTNNKFRMDRTPTSTENGDAYTFLYDKRIEVADAGDSLPFSDTVADGLLPVAVELFRASTMGTSRDVGSAVMGFIRATKLASQTKPRAAYGVVRTSHPSWNPFEQWPY